MNHNDYGKDLEIKYSHLTDEEIVELIQKSGDGLERAQDYLISKYKNVVKIKTRSYFLIGADKEDIMQEGMIGLYKAIRDFKADKNVAFYSFAELCITRQIITAIKSATRQKHIPLNSYISLNNTVDDEDNGNGKSHLELLAETRISNPEDLFISKENKDGIETKISKKLSEFEKTVLKLFIQGSSYQEIAQVIGKNEKAVDNAIQRIRKKVSEILVENEQKEIELKTKKPKR